MVAVLALGVRVVLRRAGDSERFRSAGGAAGWVAVWCVAVAVTQVGVLTARGTTGMIGADPPPAPADRVVVLVLNTRGEVSAADLAAFVAERGADVVSLPETTRATAAKAAELLAGQGRHYQVLAEVLSGGTNPSTAALVAQDLGSYAVTAHGTAASFVATGTGPPLTIVHTRAPVDPDLRWWAATTRAAVESCTGHPGGIVAGDFNATLDHPAFDHLDGCVDAAAASGSAAVGTWPVAAPRALGTPIDHVLVDPTVWTVQRAAVLDPPPGTDHRAVEAVLTPAGGTG